MKGEGEVLDFSLSTNQRLGQGGEERNQGPTGRTHSTSPSSFLTDHLTE